MLIRVWERGVWCYYFVYNSIQDVCLVIAYYVQACGVIDVVMKRKDSRLLPFTFQVLPGEVP